MGLIIVGLGFLAVLLAVLLFDWLMKRWTGYGVLGSLEEGKYNRRHLDFLKQPDFYGEAESISKREKKETPHFDALVDAEWQAANASRLEDALPENESEEPRSLGDLLEVKQKKP